MHQQGANHTLAMMLYDSDAQSVLITCMQFLQIPMQQLLLGGSAEMKQIA